MKASNDYKFLKKRSKNLSCDVSKLSLITASLPLGAFIFCTTWSLLFNFKEATSTHCHVKNYLPSISASVGNFEPQKYIWRVSIGLHSAPRYGVAFMYYLLKHGSFVIFISNVLEITFLLGLTFISSTENFGKLRVKFKMPFN